MVQPSGCQVNDQERLKKDIFTFLIVSPFILNGMNKITVILKEKLISFSLMRFSINLIHPLQRKMVFRYAPGSVPFNHKNFFPSFFPFYI
jgi:hypothetical protein